MARVLGLALLAVATLVPVATLVQSVASQNKIRSGNCVKVPDMCYKLISNNYTHMRLPNMLNHTRREDVAGDLNLWMRLLASKDCNAGNQLKYFLCFTYAPVCVDSKSMDKLIPPCSSMCRTVRRSCEPVMKEHNYSWPEVFNCDQRHRFLDDASQMCISSKILDLIKFKSSQSTNKCSCKKDYKDNRQLKSLFCRSDLVFRGKLVKKRLVKRGPNANVYKIEVTTSRIIRATKDKKEDVAGRTLSMNVFNDKRQNCRCGKLRVRKRHRGNGQFFFIVRKQNQKLQVDAIGKWNDMPNSLKRKRVVC